MTEAVKSLRERGFVRWTALILASLSIFGAYYFNYALSAIKPVLESALGWSSSDFGTYTSAYGWFNVFAFMLVISGLILDKLGVRKTGIGATTIMFIGTFINYWAISHTFPEGARIFGLKAQIFWSAIGFALFGVGTEAIGITISKAVVRWFKGKEMALAMGMQMAIARLGTLLALAISIPLAKEYSATGPIVFALILMLLGIVSFISYSILEIRLDKSEKTDENVKSDEDDFRISDIKLIITNRGFWYIAILCVLFYSAVFPFLFYANDLMINKYHVAPKLAGLIPSLLPFGTILLTPLFGGIYDSKGKGATIMIIGALILVLVHGVLAIPFLKAWWIAATMVIILGIGFSLVPSAMWPSVPKIIPEKQLGTAYAVIFWIQNIGLMTIPLLLGFVLEKTNPDVAPNKKLIKSSMEIAIKQTVPPNILTEKEMDLLVEKITGDAIDTVVQSTDYIPAANIDTTQFKAELASVVQQNLTNINWEAFKKEKKRKSVWEFIKGVVKSIFGKAEEEQDINEEVSKIVASAAYGVITKYKLNIRYDYFYDILIFVVLAVTSVLFALLLKREDKIKGYGLELPNKADKLKEHQEKEE